MRRLNLFLAIGIAGVIALLAGLSWDALAHAADPHLARDEHLFTLANPAHATLLGGVGLVVVGVVGALDASLRASGTTWSSPRRRRATSGAAAVLVATALAVAGWAVNRPLQAPVAIAPAGEHAATDGHHASDDTGAVATATAQHEAEADALVTATKLALASAGYEDVATARAAGYLPVQPPTAPLVHYVHPGHLASPAVLDPSAPESLVYRSTPEGLVLQGAMYVLPSVDSPVPEVGGLAAHWHGHDDLCFSTTTAMIVGTTGPDGTCPQGARNEVTPPMLHVWTIDHPEGPFAGYLPVQPPTAPLVHYVHPGHLASPAVLDPSAPESLVYRSTPEGLVLQGAMYVLPSVDSPVPEVGGLAAHWHGHDDLCFSTTTAMIVGTIGPDGTCPQGARNEVTPPMLHVWTIDHPEGPFAGL